MNEISALSNRLDFHLYQDSLYFCVFLLAALSGMIVGQLIWRADEERCRELEWENRRLEADGAGHGKA